MNDKKLYRNASDTMLTGVCGGLGEYLGMDATVIRLVWALVVVFTGFVPGILVYIVAVIVMPKKVEVVSAPAASVASDTSGEPSENA